MARVLCRRRQDPFWRSRPLLNTFWLSRPLLDTFWLRAHRIFALPAPRLQRHLPHLDRLFHTAVDHGRRRRVLHCLGRYLCGLRCSPLSVCRRQIRHSMIYRLCYQRRHRHRHRYDRDGKPRLSDARPRQRSVVCVATTGDFLCYRFFDLPTDRLCI